ncbi:HupE/UreJ family protein [Undibacterium sp. TJN25]|uniref:HupE/UreJ family protein n=1 Tax=Undibacterium sp. TJN25 TaxID=3413056 RepID=UPI003BF36AE5
MSYRHSYIARILIAPAACLFCSLAQAHAGSADGWLHPLTGLDHLLAMIAVGAWSSQIGGRAVWFVPTAFVCCMLLGGVAGFEQFDIPGVEAGVALSVLVLGLAIGCAKALPILIASATVGTFGVFHGYAHGYEMPVMDDKFLYVAGFLASTATLHLIGAIGAYFVLKCSGGARILKCAGFACALCGTWLTYAVLFGV